MEIIAENNRNQTSPYLLISLTKTKTKKNQTKKDPISPKKKDSSKNQLHKPKNQKTSIKLFMYPLLSPTKGKTNQTKILSIHQIHQTPKRKNHIPKKTIYNSSTKHKKSSFCKHPIKTKKKNYEFHTHPHCTKLHQRK